MLKPITPAHIHWDEFGLPLNAQDVYRSHLGSKDLGLDQAQKVFLQGCQLSGRGALWETQDHWVILELGFGLGLNFLATWQEWKNNRLRPKRLYYVALEANPARAEDILRSTQVWPELMPLAQVLVDDWWGLDAGLHTLRFERGQLHLLLSLGQAQETLHSLQLVADSVYLDGFSPTSNPEMWSFDVLSAIAKHSHKTTRLATWCVAKEVVNNLHALGFKCEKVTGLPPKKFSLVAKNNDNLPDRQSILPQKCLVLGHGIAGASVAQQLAACGWQVSVFDVAKGLSPASQVPIALVYPHVNQSGEGLGQLTRQGLRALFNHLPLLPDFSYQMSGVDEQFQGRKAKQFAENKLFQTPDWLKACSAKGWLHQPAGWLIPQFLVTHLLAHPRIQVRVLHAPPIPEYTDDAWCLYDAQRTLIDTGQALVLALGAYTDSFLQEHFGLKLLTQPVRGQLSYYPLPPILPEGWPSLASVAKKSMIPARLDKEQQALFVGASFDRHRDQAIIDHTDRQTHLQYLAQNHRSVFDFLADLGEQGWQDFAGVRSMLADRLPVVGAVNGQKNVYILSGLGSRGFSLGLLCGELLASQINAHPWPVSLGQGNSLDCNRYLRSKPD